ncbi:MAG: polysaccharide biosynthesis tyrosine autokinase [Anaerolineae bacterium]|nr:polysaccharide biosynthesis tyrosine autokinase [Anaerolineae bacterium]
MEEGLDLRRYAAVLRRWWWLIIGCALLAAASAYAVSTQLTPVYKASVTLLVHQASTSGTSDYAAILTSERQARTYAEMITEQPVLEAVVAQPGFDMDWQDLASRVDVELVQDTQLIRLSVEDTDNARAAQAANAIAAAFIAQNKALQQERYAESLGSVRQQMDELSTLIEQTQAAIDNMGVPETAQQEAELSRLEIILAGYRTSYVGLLQSYEQMRLTAAQTADNVSVFRQAEAPDLDDPVSPRKMLNTALAGAVGGLLAVGVAFLVEYLDDTIKTPEDVNRALGLDTLGVIGKLAKGTEELVAVTRPLSPVSEAFRVLRTNIRFSSVDKPIRTLLVTSAGPTEGKSTTAANLAAVMAQAGLKAIIVDADLRRPRLHQVFGIHPRGGLTGSLLEGTMDGRLQPSQVEGLAVLPAGERPPNPSELLGSRRLRELLGLLTQHVDVVVIDSPPVLPVTDAAVLAQSVDGVLLVIDAGETRRGIAQHAVESLRQVGANVIGAVLNRMSAGKGGYYYYREYYGDGGEKRKQREHKKQKTPTQPR